MKFSAAVLLILSMVCFGCEPEAELSRTFKISKGEHYSVPRIVDVLESNTFQFKAKFNSSAIYQFSDEGFQDSKNKLMGFSDCNSQHHENSARFAWQWYDDQLEIYAYCYVDGKRVEEYVGVVQLNDFNDYQISITADEYIFKLNEKPAVKIKRGHVCDKGVYYLLWPYFGGSIAAPHDVTIDIVQSF
jgi:hypothetical protein